jgi:hypothetical protein
MILVGLVGVNQIFGKVTIRLNQKTFRHDGRVFEPVRITISNNSLSPIYFLEGCAVKLPEVYKLNNGVRESILTSQLVCEAVPRVVTIMPLQSGMIGWDQKSLYKLVTEGQYQIGFKYSHKTQDRFDVGPTKEVFSEIFNIKETVWTKNEQIKICETCGPDFHSNDYYYSTTTCLRNLEN